jgi:CheY-like chemotaxis protein
VFEAAVNDARPLLDARDIVLAVTSTTGSVPIHADATRVEQVISNLLSNAAKFTEPGGKVEIALGVFGQEALLVVHDTGRGIPDRMTDQVFEPFVQVDPGLDRAKGGLGLGLTLVRKLVEMHGGRVRASSGGPGQGSTFEVRLPLRVVEKKKPAPSGSAAPVAERSLPRRVLVVEDSSDVRETLAEFLRSLGHEVELAATGPEGAEKLVTVRPDVALVDIGLPGMDGYEVARTVRERPEGRSLFLVALTGYGGAEVEATARQAGFDVHLVKPVETARLMALIDGVPAGHGDPPVRR